MYVTLGDFYWDFDSCTFKGPRVIINNFLISSALFVAAPVKKVVKMFGMITKGVENKTVSALCFAVLYNIFVPKSWQLCPCLVSTPQEG